jgi:hypothetical protein
VEQRELKKDSVGVLEVEEKGTSYSQHSRLQQAQEVHIDSQEQAFPY